MDCGWLWLELWIVLHHASDDVRSISPSLGHLLSWHTSADVNLDSRFVPVVSAPHHGIGLGQTLRSHNRLHRVEAISN